MVLTVRSVLPEQTVRSVLLVLPDQREQMVLTVRSVLLALPDPLVPREQMVLTARSVLQVSELIRSKLRSSAGTRQTKLAWTLRSGIPLKMLPSTATISG
jgi:hypothetical protein